MIRIARIKFRDNDEIYEYLCSDKSIVEGDVVYLEDRANPSFIYEIKEEDIECKVYKKVLTKAIPNDKVRLSYKYADITTVNTDCIVNSLGTNIREFGSICQSIYEAANSCELDDYLNSKSIGHVFDIIVTDAGKLPSNHIINIVMPYKYEDKNNEQLYKAFSLVIDKAIELNYKSIAIPYIGTGANGYNFEDINETLNDVMFNYQYKEGIEIDILSIRYHRTRVNRREIRYEGYNTSGSINVPVLIKKRYSMDNVRSIQDAIRRNYNKYDELNLEQVCSPADFIRAAIKNAGGYSKVPLINTILNNDARKNLASFRKTIKKEEIYRSAIILKLNFTQIIQFMEISGYTFSPATKNDLDIEVFNYIVNNNGFTKPYMEIADYFDNLNTKTCDTILNFESFKRTKKTK